MRDILVAPFRGVVDAFLERALKVRHRLRTTPEPHPTAKVITTSLACPAVVTRHTNFQCYPVANLEACNRIPDSYHNPGALVPERQRVACLKIAIAEFIVIGAIATADTSGFDSYLELIGSRVRDETSFLMERLAARIQHV
jgi:hypothetical protein